MSACKGAVNYNPSSYSRTPPLHFNTPVQINTVNTLQNIADTFRLFTNASSGNYTLSFEEFSSVPLTKAILLRDLFNNTVTDLRLTNTYTFSINSTAGSAGNRFQLIFIDQSTLPVEFIKVNARAKGDDIVVNWSTATEKNNSKFIIEKSIDGVNFENAGEVKGAGNSSVVRNYTFTDTNAAANASLLNIPVMYYRIRQVDFSGEFSFSNRVSVFFIRNSAQQANNITVFPNPAVDKVTITTANETFGVIGIYNLNGKMVKEQIQLAQETEVFVGDLNAGVYIVKLSDGSTQKLIKQ
ncbi:MAG: T9SS type A sorting domain-containing protein [Bacteroidia bacterium]|nr:T9SS type A sorting domain-containing protein [Bacteroidia bacterium]